MIGSNQVHQANACKTQHEKHKVWEMSVMLATHFQCFNAQCPTIDEDKWDISNIPYDKIVGNIMFFDDFTRSGSNLTIRKVSRFKSSIRFIRRELNEFLNI